MHLSSFSLFFNSALLGRKVLRTKCRKTGENTTKLATKIKEQVAWFIQDAPECIYRFPYSVCAHQYFYVRFSWFIYVFAFVYVQVNVTRAYASLVLATSRNSPVGSLKKTKWNATFWNTHETVVASCQQWLCQPAVLSCWSEKCPKDMHLMWKSKADNAPFFFA